jgi:hypothetical protein
MTLAVVEEPSRVLLDWRGDAVSSDWDRLSGKFVYPAAAATDVTAVCPSMLPLSSPLLEDDGEEADGDEAADFSLDTVLLEALLLVLVLVLLLLTSGVVSPVAVFDDSNTERWRRRPLQITTAMQIASTQMAAAMTMGIQIGNADGDDVSSDGVRSVFERVDEPVEVDEDAAVVLAAVVVVPSPVVKGGGDAVVLTPVVLNPVLTPALTPVLTPVLKPVLKPVVVTGEAGNDSHDATWTELRIGLVGKFVQFCDMPPTNSLLRCALPPLRYVATKAKVVSSDAEKPSAESGNAMLNSRELGGVPAPPPAARFVSFGLVSRNRKPPFRGS